MIIRIPEGHDSAAAVPSKEECEASVVLVDERNGVGVKLHDLPRDAVDNQSCQRVGVTLQDANGF